MWKKKKDREKREEDKKRCDLIPAEKATVIWAASHIDGGHWLAHRPDNCCPHRPWWKVYGTETLLNTP